MDAMLQGLGVHAEIAPKALNERLAADISQPSKSRWADFASDDEDRLSTAPSSQFGADVAKSRLEEVESNVEEDEAMAFLCLMPKPVDFKTRWADIGSDEELEEPSLAERGFPDRSTVKSSSSAHVAPQITKPAAAQAFDEACETMPSDVDTSRAQWSTVKRAKETNKVDCIATRRAKIPGLKSDVANGRKAANHRVGRGQAAAVEKGFTRTEPPSNRAHREVHTRGNTSQNGSVAPRAPPRGHKVQSQFIIGIEEEQTFRVTRKILGQAGANMKRIAQETGVKLRLRGQGSNFLEGADQLESTDPLMLCVSSPDHGAHDAATRLVEELLADVYSQYRRFCARSGMPIPDLQVSLHTGAREGAKPQVAARSRVADAW